MKEIVIPIAMLILVGVQAFLLWSALHYYNARIKEGWEPVTWGSWTVGSVAVFGVVMLLISGAMFVLALLGYYGVISPMCSMMCMSWLPYNLLDVRVIYRRNGDVIYRGKQYSLNDVSSASRDLYAFCNTVKVVFSSQNDPLLIQVSEKEEGKVIGAFALQG